MIYKLEGHNRPVSLRLSKDTEKRRYFLMESVGVGLTLSGCGRINVLTPSPPDDQESIFPNSPMQLNFIQIALNQKLIFLDFT